ncbi:MAG: hypothetical protein JHC33_01550 [Ignisphaera sp.]|nr:hypothetical protein [Ignisphaera sp.]
MSNGYAIVKISNDAPKHVKIRIRKLMKGTTVTLKGKSYRSRGLLEQVNGIALACGLYIVPVNQLDKVLSVLRERNLDRHVEIINLCTCPCS